MVRLPRPQHAVVVDHRGTLYRLVGVEDSIGRHPRGLPFWLEASDFEPTGRTSKRARRLYRAWQKSGGDAHLCPRICACGPHYRGFEPEPDD